MVDDGTYLLSRVFSRLSESLNMHPSSQEDSSESKLRNGKIALDDDADDDEELRQSKSLKLTRLSIQENDSDQQQENGDGDSLINDFGRDMSISCLLRCSRSDYCSVACLNKSFLSLVKSGDFYRLRRQNMIIENWVYFSCQPEEWVAFNPVEGRWMNLPEMDSSEAFKCGDRESLAVGTDLLVLGTDDEDDSSHVVYRSQFVYRYSLLTNSWSLGKRMNSPRCLFGSASSGEIAIFAGGCDFEGKISDVAEMYNSELQTWTTLPNMNKPRKMSSGVFIDGKFYVIGGIGGCESKLLTCGEEYDLETKKWTEIPEMSPPMNSASGAPPLVAVVNNELYAADHAAMEVRKYDKESKKWFTLGRFLERAGSVDGWGLAFRACGERLIVIGGPRNFGGGFIELNSWIPSNDRSPPVWTLLGRKHSANFVFNCAVMGC